MATNNSINNTLASPFNVGATSVTSTGVQLNYLSALTAAPINKMNVQKIASNGTYTPTAGMVCGVGATSGAADGVAAPANTGAGGSGGFGIASNQAGGAGGSGLVVITEFLSA